MPLLCCYWQEQWHSVRRSGVIILRSLGLSSNVCLASFCEHVPPLEVVDFTNGGGLELPFPPSPDALSKCLNQCLSFHALSPCVFVYTVLSVHAGSMMHLFAYNCYFWGRPLRLGSLLGVQNEKCCLYNLCVIVSSSPVCQSLATLGLKQAVLRMAFLFKCCLSWQSSFNTHRFNRLQYYY